MALVVGVCPIANWSQAGPFGRRQNHRECLNLFSLQRVLKSADGILNFARGPVCLSLGLEFGIWICGDCHLGNLGPLAHAKGRVAIQIRDLDNFLTISSDSAARTGQFSGDFFHFALRLFG